MCSTPNCVSSVVCRRRRTHIYPHYLTNYKRNLIYPVILPSLWRENMQPSLAVAVKVASSTI